ncbi:MAG: hypothetical protein KAG98_03895 [Lentisphaeria bacterium]|nr:hypothetical protein [Lentisphaeria bacterium]
MQIFKDNYGKLILGISLLCLVLTLAVLKGGVVEARELVVLNNLETLMSDEEGGNPVYKNELQVMDLSLKDTTTNGWVHQERAGFSFDRYVYCSLGSCGRLNKFHSKVCYNCGTSLGLSVEEKAIAFVEKQRFQDGDGDGIINGLEDQFDFMDKANKNDAFLDEDNDGFVNLREITAGKTIEEQAEMLKANKSFVFNPASALSHPPLVELLRVKSLNQAREMGVTLKSVNEIEVDKKTWEVAFNRVRKSGRRETIWKKIGQDLNTNNGLKFEITGIQKFTKEVFVKSVNAKRTVSTYLVEAKTTEGDIYHIKSKLFEKQGSKVIQFVYLNQPFYKKLVPMKVIMNENFMLTVGIKGAIVDRVEYQLVGVKSKFATIKEVKTNLEYEIKKISKDDIKYLKKRALSEKNK